MTFAPKTIQHDQPLEDAAEYMRKLHVRHLPVMRAGKVVGILTSRELNLLSAFNDLDLLSEKVEAAMIRNPVSVDLMTPLADVARIMVEGECSGVLVTERGKTIGIFTEIDALRALAEYFDETE